MKYTFSKGIYSVECDREINIKINGETVFVSNAVMTGSDNDTLLTENGKITVTDEGILLDGDFEADIYYGDDVFAISTKDDGSIRCAIGPAVSSIDDALWNRQTDSALIFGGDVKLGYDKSRKTYTARVFGKAKLFAKDNILADKFGIIYNPINKNATFKKAPAGWMTWYAVKFNACEETVLENLEFQEKNLKSFGADAFWIDWEWFHRDMKGFRADGVNNFSPDPKKYPNGLKFISDKIKEAGFTPALWTGFTNDVAINEYTEKNPEIILAEAPTWCGIFFYDFSHPKYIEEFIPKVFSQVAKWGYEAIKFDTIPNSLTYHDQFHDKMYDPSLSTKEAFRRVMKKVREVVGNDTYMLSCAAIQDRDILWSSDFFDAARVGDDVFDWDTFSKQCIDKTKKFYPLHNTTLYADPDNLVLREEFNTLTQAKSRTAFISLLGLPLTLGDDFKVLDSERVDLIKRALPVMDIHPMCLDNPPCERDTLLTNLAISTENESYNVVSVLNRLKSPVMRFVDIKKDLHLEGDKWHIFDFFNEKYLGAVDSFDLTLDGCETVILSVREATDKPQIVSTSRHVTQGAAEIEKLDITDSTITLTSNLVGGDEYRVYLHLPNRYTVAPSEEYSCEMLDGGIARIRFMPEKDGQYTLQFNFKK